MNNVIKDVLLYLGCTNISIDCDEDLGAIREQFASKKYNNSLSVCYPEIAKEWHPNKNGKLTPDKVNKSARAKVWWLGNCGHEWVMPVKERTRTKSQGCPVCGGKVVLQGYNDLLSQSPEIAKEWHPTKNGELKPSEIMNGSSQKVWWLLPYDDELTGKHFDFEWEAKVNARTRRKQGCPYLSNKSVMEGFNDLGTRYPQIAEEWNYEKNKGLTDKRGKDISVPSKIVYGSGFKVWWKCKTCSNEWSTTPKQRIEGNGCPICNKPYSKKRNM